MRRFARAPLAGLALTAILIAVAPAMAAGVVADGSAPDPSLILERLSAQALLDETPLQLENVRLETSFAKLTLRRGLLFLAAPVGELAAEMVFVGEGFLHLEPADEVEAGQIELFTGSPSLEERFNEAVLVVTRDTAARALARRAVAPPDSAAANRAANLYRRWRESPERLLLGVDAGLLQDALGDPLAEDYFSAWLAGDELGEFLLLEDPSSHEQLTVGQFVPLEANQREKRRVARFLHRQQKRGRLIGLDLGDLGVFDTWTAASRRHDGRLAPGRPAFEPVNYTLDVTARPDDGGRLEGRAKVQLRATTGERRVLHLQLHRDLELRALIYDGRELPYLRRDTEIYAVLPSAPPLEETVEVEIEYGGVFFDRGGAGNWDLRDGLGWYPHAGEVDRATYDVTLRRPPRLDLLASGQWTASGEIDGLRWERRRLDRPSIGFSFAVGRFEVRKTRAGRVAVTVAFDPGLTAASGDSLDQITATVSDALLFYERIFGPYPLAELVVVTVPREYSQAMLGFVTLSNTMMIDWGPLGGLFGISDRRTVVAHEIAHQWWGHQIGWRSYRDQWISEAMANWAALLWTGRHPQIAAEWIGPTAGWQEELTSPTDDGRPLESLGPLVLGQRLDSSRSSDAYQAIVYRKGALVMGMLARTLGEAHFNTRLAGIIAEHQGRSLSTDEFLAALAHGADLDLDGFARQFVYGTGLPEIYYDYQVEPLEEGRWRVRIVARQEPSYRFLYEVVETPDGGLDVARQRLDEGQAGSAPWVVPFQVAFADSQLGVHGRMELDGEVSEFDFVIDHPPAEVWLDARRETFGRFFSVRRHPKRRLFDRGFDLAAAGERRQAEEILRQALATSQPAPVADFPGLERLQALAERWLDAQIHLELTRLAIDEGRFAAASRSLEEAATALSGSEREWIRDQLLLLETRLDLRRGDARQAYKRLRREVLKKRRLSSTESLLLMAIAARLTGHEKEVETAIGLARRQGADVTLLSTKDDR